MSFTSGSSSTRQWWSHQAKGDGGGGHYGDKDVGLYLLGKNASDNSVNNAELLCKFRETSRLSTSQVQAGVEVP